MAMVASPGRSLRSAGAIGSGSTPPLTCFGSTLSSAMSVLGSCPSTRAAIGSPFSPKRTRTCSASSTTCWLVTILPSSEITKPEPDPLWTPLAAWTKTTAGETRS
jgi:hypothetical protein